jgi:hypothetical protein
VKTITLSYTFFELNVPAGKTASAGDAVPAIDAARVGASPRGA